MRNPHKESRVLRHLRIADGYLKSGNKLTKAVFRNLIEKEGDLLGITEETKENYLGKSLFPLTPESGSGEPKEDE